MEIFVYVMIALFFGIFIGTLLQLGKGKPAELPKKEETPVDFITREERQRVLDVELKERLEQDTERWIIEATDKSGKIYKTAEFEPNGCYYPQYDHGWNDFKMQFRYDSKTYNDSKKMATFFVEQAQHRGQRLVQFGDEFICQTSIVSVKLVKTK